MASETSVMTLENIFIPLNVQMSFPLSIGSGIFLCDHLLFFGVFLFLGEWVIGVLGRCSGMNSLLLNLIFWGMPFDTSIRSTVVLIIMGRVGVGVGF